MLYFNPKLTGESFKDILRVQLGNYADPFFLANEEQSEMKITELEMS